MGAAGRLDLSACRGWRVSEGGTDGVLRIFVGYLYQREGLLPLLCDRQSAWGRGFLKVCQLGCTGQSHLLGHSELLLMHWLHPHHRVLLELLMGARDALLRYSSDMLQAAYRWRLLPLQAVKLSRATPGWPGAFIGRCLADLSKKVRQSYG